MVQTMTAAQDRSGRSRTSPGDIEDVMDTFLDGIDGADSVSIDDIQDAVGRRAFGPLLLVFAVIVLSPVGGIPGVPTVFGIIVVLLAGQLLIGRKQFWLPRAIRDREIEADRLRAGIERTRPAVARIDKVIRPRVTVLTGQAGAYCIAACCVVLASFLPVLELLPFAAAAPAAAIAAFALALVAHDGLFAVIGYVGAAGSAYLAATVIGA